MLCAKDTEMGICSIIIRGGCVSGSTLFQFSLYANKIMDDPFVITYSHDQAICR